MIEIPLLGKYSHLFAKIDDKDFALVSRHKWRGSKVRENLIYAKTEVRNPFGKSSTVLMHRMILRTAYGMDTDHRDGDGLNNQRHNLREATRSQNRLNTRRHREGFRGNVKRVVSKGRLYLYDRLTGERLRNEEKCQTDDFGKLLSNAGKPGH